MDTISHLVVTMIISAIGSAILVLAGMPPTAWRVSILGFLGFVVSGIMGVVVVVSILRNKRSDWFYFLKTRYTAAIRKTKASIWFHLKVSVLNASVLKRTKTVRVITSCIILSCIREKGPPLP